MKIIFSNHALERMRSRNIERKEVEDGINNPDSIKEEEGKIIFQIVLKRTEKSFLLRIFVNKTGDLFKVVTVYKTSKMEKYL